MVRKTALIFAAGTLLSGCAMSSGVLEMSPGLYSVSQSVGVIRGGVAGATKMAFKQAQSTCSSQGKKVDVVQQGTNFQPVSGLETATLTFRCVP